MNIKIITKISIFTAMLSVIAPFTIPINLIPITLTTLMIFILSAVLKPIEALMVVVLYLTLGLIGVPVFASFGAGFNVLVGPSGGYLTGYLISTSIMSLIIKTNKEKFCLYPISFFVGTLIIYLFGSLQFMIVTNNSFVQSLMIGVLPFIVGDVIKIVIGTFVSYYLNKKFVN